MLHTHLIMLALTALALTAAGCGGSSKTQATTTSAATSPATTATATTATTTTTTAATTTAVPVITVKVASGTPLTTAQWIARGDAICAHLNEKRRSIPVRSIRELVRVLPENVAFERTEVSELSKLVPPAARASDWEQILTTTLQWAEGSAKLEESVKPGESVAKSPLIPTITAIHTHLTEIAQRDGFKTCSHL